MRRFSDSAIEVEENAERRREDLIDLQHERPAKGEEEEEEASASSSAIEAGNQEDLPTPSTTTTTSTTTTAVDDLTLSQRPPTPDFDTTVHIPEIFLFEYGVVVIWGMSVSQEQRFLNEIAKFEMETLAKDDVQTEEFNFYYTREYQARIYNDFISLREKRNYMTKLAISHALAQSTKVCF